MAEEGVYAGLVLGRAVKILGTICLLLYRVVLTDGDGSIAGASGSSNAEYEPISAIESRCAHDRDNQRIDDDFLHACLI